MPAMKHPYNGAVVDVAADLVARFAAQGWVPVAKPAPSPEKRKPGRPRKES